MSTRTQDRVGGSIDTLTVAGIAGTAYILGTAVHEFAGHALTCAALGGRVRELNAFYVDCDYLGMADGTIRAVALAGPVASLLLGLFAFVLVQKSRSKSVPLQIFLWLLGSIGMMTATGYLLFSGALGLGDFGTDRDGVLFELSPEWAWRIAITLLGLAGYAYSMRKSIVVINTFANYPVSESTGSGWIRPSPVTCARSRRNKPGSGFSGRSLITSSAYESPR